MFAFEYHNSVPSRILIMKCHNTSIDSEFILYHILIYTWQFLFARNIRLHVTLFSCGRIDNIHRNESWPILLRSVTVCLEMLRRGKGHFSRGLLPWDTAKG